MSRMTATHTNSGGPSTPRTATTPKRPPLATTTSHTSTLQRLRAGGEAASTLQSSAVAAIGSLTSLPSSSTTSTPTSLHALTPKRTLKIVLIGDGGCGKTSIRNRFLTSHFYPSYRATIGADFITKTLPLADGTKATLQIWDTAGQERFQSLGSAFYRGADAVIIAFDASKGEEEAEKVRRWYEAFMDKAPGPKGEEERRRFCWVCAANKVDLLEEGGLDREKVWEVLDGLVEREVGQIDYGQGGAVEVQEEPVDPSEVLSRPDPNGVDSPSVRGGATPISLKDINGNASPSSVDRRSRDYRLSRKSLSSIAAAAAKSAQSNESDADEPDANPGGTMKTLYTTPSNTLTKPAQLSSSPKQTGSFLSTWGRRSQSKPPRHQKRQSIKSIEVFQISDQESDTSERITFPSSSSAPKGKRSEVNTLTPPRSTFGKDRQRVDSTLSLNAPSVYHTPRSSTFFSASPTPRTTLGLPTGSTRTNGDLSVGSLHLDREQGSSLKHKPSTVSSNLSVATIKPPNQLKTPKSINDLFQPSPPPPTSPSPPRTPSTISLPLTPPPPPPPSSLEHGFTLFYTSAKSSLNIDRMFQHILHRVVANTAYQDAQLAASESAQEREQRQTREQELIRRTIRLASGKTNDRWFGCC